MRTCSVRPFLCAAALFGAQACSSTPEETGGAGGTGGSGGSTTTGGTGPTTTLGTTTPSSTTSSTTELPPVFTVSGIVTDGDAPLEGAIVMQGGGTPDFVTGPDGAFSIEITQQIPGQPAVVATKIGYRTRGVELDEVPAEPIVLALLAAEPPDNQGYKFHPPGVGDPAIDNNTSVCGHCHTKFVAQYRASAHARATKDPLVQDLYAGVSGAAPDAAACSAAGGVWKTGLVPGTEGDAAQRCYVGGGVLPDLNAGCGGPAQPACDDPALAAANKPAAFGACADCHAPGMDGKAGGRNLLEATGIAFDAGNHCDVCHKARDVDLSKPAGVAGALVLQRPREKVSDDPGAKVIQVMFGPLPDVANEFMGGSYQPKFTTSDLCGACHEQRQPALLPGASLDPGRWPEGLPVHSTYSEWKDSSFNTPGTPCQFCHMPPDDTGLQSTVDVTNAGNASVTFGFVRPPEQIRKHTFRGPLSGTPRFIDSALNLVLSLSLGSGAGGEALVTADVAIQNILAGHAIPTGEPMRALVLVVRAEGCGSALAAVGGGTVQDGGGALASGVVGGGVQVNGMAVTWAGAGGKAAPGMRIRIVRASGVFDDYAGVGFFADPGLTAEEKGLPVFSPVGEAAVVSAAGDSITLDAAIPAAAGDVVYLGEALPAVIGDGDASRAVAGAAGYVFQKTLVDPAGARGVHHYRAVDIVSDNRVPPQGSAGSRHTFALPVGCDAGKVTATLMYRPVPVDMARLRGWEAKDWVVGKATETFF